MQIKTILISIFLTAYYICRYGLKGAEQKVDKMCKEKLEQVLLEELRIGKDA